MALPAPNTAPAQAVANQGKAAGACCNGCQASKLKAIAAGTPAQAVANQTKPAGTCCGACDPSTMPAGGCCASGATTPQVKPAVSN
jgi:hypothetical protein